MAPKKKNPLQPAKSDKKQTLTLSEQLVEGTRHLSDKEFDELIRPIEFKSRILELNQKSESLLIELRQLLQDYPDREDQIADEYFHLAYQFTKDLNKMKVGALGAIAELNTDWPIMVGRTTRQRVSPAQEKFLKDIGLGKQMPRSVGVKLMENAVNPPTIAWLLVSVVDSIKPQTFVKHSPDSSYGKIQSVLNPKLRVLLQRKVRGTQEWRPEHAKKFKQALEQLTPLTPASVDGWIEACLALFICMTEDQYEHPKYPFGSWAMSKESQKSARGLIIDRLRDALRSAYHMPRKSKSIRKTANA